MSYQENPPSSEIGTDSIDSSCRDLVATPGVSEENVRDDPGAFLLLWVASGANSFAYWVMQLALLLFAKQLTSSPFLVAGISFTLNVPWFAFSLPAGALVDRYDRRSMLVAMTILRLLALGFALFMAIPGYVTLPLLYGIALILGVTQTLEEPALTAAVFMVVPQERLEKANAWLAGAQNVIGLLAFPLGGIFASINIILSISVGGGCAAAALVVLLLLRGSFHPSRTTRRHIMVEVFEGVRFLWSHQVLWILGIMAGVINACWGGYLAVLVLYAVAPGPVGLTPTAYGVLLISDSLGSVIGTLLTVPVQRWLGRRWAIGLNIIGNTVMFIAPALTTNPWLIGGTAVIGGIVGSMWTIAATSLQGRLVPTALQGRVNAAYHFLGVGSAAIGPIFSGLLAQIFGLRASFLVCAFLTLLMLIPFFSVITEEAMSRTRTGM